MVPFHFGFVLYPLSIVGLLERSKAKANAWLDNKTLQVEAA